MLCSFFFLRFISQFYLLIAIYLFVNTAFQKVKTFSQYFYIFKCALQVDDGVWRRRDWPVIITCGFKPALKCMRLDVMRLNGKSGISDVVNPC